MADGFRLYNTSLTSHGRREGGVDSENLFRFIFVINRNRSLLELVARIRTDANYKLYERPVDNTGLTERATDRTNASSLHKVKLESNEGLKKRKLYTKRLLSEECNRSCL